MSKTMTKTVDSVIADAEAATMKQHGPAVAQYEAMVSRYRQAEKDLYQAQAEVAEMESAMLGMSDNYDDMAYALASAKVVRLSKNLEGKEPMLTQAARQIPNVDKKVAEALADVLTRHSQGRTPAYATFVTNHNLTEFFGRDPFYVVIQGGPSEVSGSGSMSGSLAIYRMRDKGHHVDLTEETLKELLAANHIDGKVLSVTSKDDHQIIRLNVRRIAPAIPPIQKVNSLTLNNVALNVAAELVGNVINDDRERKNQSTNPPGYLHRRIAVGAQSKVVSVDVDANGVRTITYDAGLAVEVLRADLIDNGLPYQVDKVVSGLAGKFLPGIGRITSAALVREESNLHVSNTNAIEKYVPVDDSPKRAGLDKFRDIRQVIIRITIVSKTG